MEHKLTREEKSRKLIEDFSNLVNDFGFEPEHLIESFKREHRTLQQSMFRAILNIIVEVASDDYHTDGRNEASKRTARMILDGYAEELKKSELMEMGESEYFQKRAEETKKAFLKEPMLYFRLPFV